MRAAYDAATGRVVLFGGSAANGTIFGDTWTWNGSTWTQQAPVTSPHPRWYASMAYDAATRNIVLFGGKRNPNPAFGDTWIWH